MKIIVKVSIILFLLLQFSSCQDNSPEGIAKPAIPEQEMVGILTEILLVDPAIRETLYPLQDSLARHYYTRILEPKGYDLADFTQTMQWLQEDPNRLKSTYEQVLDSTTVLETRLKN